MPKHTVGGFTLVMKLLFVLHDSGGFRVPTGGAFKAIDKAWETKRLGNNPETPVIKVDIGHPKRLPQLHGGSVKLAFLFHGWVYEGYCIGLQG